MREVLMDLISAERRLVGNGWTVGVDGPAVVVATGSGSRDGTLSERDALALRSVVVHHGAVLLRGLTMLDPAGFGGLVRSISGGPLLEYTERSSPRTVVLGQVYTSTEYSPREEIFFHCENSYQSTWPGIIAFWCRKPAARGGATPIADVRRLPGHLSSSTLDRLCRRGYRITRNFGPDLGLDWPEVFGTSDRTVVERYCRAHGLDFTWTSGSRLRTETVRPALARHPVTGAPVWFNHLAFFNVATLRPAVRDAMLDSVALDQMPNNTSYGDGTPFEDDLLEEIKGAYATEAVDVDWSAGDVLVLDNMAFAHGRRAHAGSREVLVAMSQPLGWSHPDNSVLSVAAGELDLP